MNFLDNFPQTVFFQQEWVSHIRILKGIFKLIMETNKYIWNKTLGQISILCLILGLMILLLYDNKVFKSVKKLLWNREYTFFEIKAWYETLQGGCKQKIHISSLLHGFFQITLKYINKFACSIYPGSNFSQGYLRKNRINQTAYAKKVLFIEKTKKYVGSIRFFFYYGNQCFWMLLFYDEW